MTAAVAAGNTNTAAAAVEILEDGGNAVDAAVAAALACFVAEPMLASAGGGAIFLAADPGGTVEVVDCFPSAPGLEGVAAELDFVGVEVDFGVTTQVFHVGRGSATVAPVLPGLALAARTLGRLPLHRLVEPAVRMARQGVEVGRSGADTFRILWPILVRDPETTAILAGGKLPQPETVVRNPDLGDFLEAFGARGSVPPELRQGLADAFGPARGGQIGRRDVEAARAIRRAPITIEHRGWRVCTSPRAGGAMIARMLRELETASGEAVDFGANLARAGRVAHTERPLTVPGSTTHMSVVDRDGAVAAITTSNGEGSGHLVPGTGVHINNFLGEEDLNPGGFHRHAPGDPLPTMMAPTLAFGPDGQVVALGTGGANRIRSTVSGVVGRLALGRELEAAIMAPRVHAEKDTVWFERPGWDNADLLETRLGERFTRVVPFDAPAFFFGGVHAVSRASDGQCVAIGDARRDGVGRVL